MAINLTDEQKLLLRQASELLDSLRTGLKVSVPVNINSGSGLLSFTIDNMELDIKDTRQTQGRGTNDSEYLIYLARVNDGTGIDFTTGKPLKTYDEWLNS